MNRRKLLYLLPGMIPAASALLATRSYAASLPQRAKDAAGFAISIQAWSFRKFTVFEAIERAAACGATAIELFPHQKIGGPLGDKTKFDFDKIDEQIPTILEHGKKHNVTPVNFGVVKIPNEEAEARKLFKFAKAFGLYGITTESLESIDIIEKLVKEYDINVCFHNHPKPSPLWHPSTVLKAINGRDKRIGFCSDLKHYTSSNLNPLETVKKIAPHIRSFHLADRSSLTEKTDDVPLGQGVIDFPSILDAALEAGFAGNVSIEFERNWDDNTKEISQCIGYLRAYSKLRAKS